MLVWSTCIRTDCLPSARVPRIDPGSMKMHMRISVPDKAEERYAKHGHAELDGELHVRAQRPCPAPVAPSRLPWFKAC